MHNSPSKSSESIQGSTLTMEALRTNLSLLSANPPCQDLDSALCRNYGLRSLLYMQRDRARSSITEICVKVMKRVQELQAELTSEVNKIATEKVALLFEEKDKIAKLKACLLAEVNAARELLQIGNEDILAECGECKLSQLQQLLDDCSQLNTEDDSFHLQFRPAETLQSLMSATGLGHIQCSMLDVELITLPAMKEHCCYVAPINVEQQVVIKAGLSLDPVARSYLGVKLKDPSGSEVECRLEDQEDGFILHFQLLAEGIHELEVQAYDVHIKGSPFLISGEDGSCRFSNSSSGSTEGRHGILKKSSCPSVSRKSLAAVNKILLESSEIPTKYRRKSYGSPVRRELMKERRGSLVRWREGQDSGEEQEVARNSASKKRKYISSQETKKVAFLTPPTTPVGKLPNVNARVSTPGKAVSSELFNEELMVMVDRGERKTVFKPAGDLRELINAIKATDLSIEQKAFSVKKDNKKNSSDQVDFNEIIEQVNAVKISHDVSAIKQRRVSSIPVGLPQQAESSPMKPLTVDTGAAGLSSGETLSPAGVDGWQKGQRRYGAGRGRGRVQGSSVSCLTPSKLKPDSHAQSTNAASIPGPGGDAPSRTQFQDAFKYTAGSPEHHKTHKMINCALSSGQMLDGLVQDCGSSSASALELPQSGDKPSMGGRETPDTLTKTSAATSPGSHGSRASPFQSPILTASKLEQALKARDLGSPSDGREKTSSSPSEGDVCTITKTPWREQSPNDGSSTPESRGPIIVPSPGSSTTTSSAKSMKRSLSDTFTSRNDASGRTAQLLTIKCKEDNLGKEQEKTTKCSMSDDNVAVNQLEADKLNVAGNNLENVRKQWQNRVQGRSVSSFRGQGQDAKIEGQGQMNNQGQVAEGHSLFVAHKSASNETLAKAHTSIGNIALTEKPVVPSKCISDCGTSDAWSGASTSNGARSNAFLSAKSTETPSSRNQSLRCSSFDEKTTPKETSPRNIAPDDSGWDDAFDAYSSTSSVSSNHQRLSSTSSRGSLSTPALDKPPKTPDVFSPFKPGLSNNSTSGTNDTNSFKNRTPLKSEKLFTPISNKENKKPADSRTPPSPARSRTLSNSSSTSSLTGASYSRGRRWQPAEPSGGATLCPRVTGSNSGCWKDGALKDLSNIQMKFLGYIGKDSVQFPLGVAANKQHICVCHNDLVWMFDWTGKFAFKLSGGPPFNRPSAVVFNRADEIFVKDAIQIQKFSAQGKFLLAFGKEHLKHPYGLSLLDNDDILVLDTTKPSLLRFEQTGRLANETPYTAITANKRCSKCRFLTTRQQTLVVTDLGLNEVFFSQLDSTSIHKLSLFGTRPGHFNEPSGVTMDSDGLCLIADSKNNRIQVFRLDKFLGILPLPRPIMRPSDIHLTPDGILLVSNLLGHSVSVFQFT